MALPVATDVLYLFQVNYGNTRTISEICSKLPIKASEKSLAFFGKIVNSFYSMTMYCKNELESFDAKMIRKFAN